MQQRSEPPPASTASSATDLTAKPAPSSTARLAGLVAGGAAAGVYSLHCTEDSPLFYGVWYVLAILAVAAVGALAGARVLRW